MKYIILSVSVFVGLFSFTPTHAYYMTHATATHLSATTTLFVIDFAFGHDDHSIDIPVLATTHNTSKSDRITYHIESKSGNNDSGTSTALVLSRMPIDRDGMYHIDRHDVGTFSLVILLNREMNEQHTPLRVQVDALPFRFDQERELSLTPSELQYYRTPFSQ